MKVYALFKWEYAINDGVSCNESQEALFFDNFGDARKAMFSSVVDKLKILLDDDDIEENPYIAIATQWAIVRANVAEETAYFKWQIFEGEV